VGRHAGRRAGQPARLAELTAGRHAGATSDAMSARYGPSPARRRHTGPIAHPSIGFSAGFKGPDRSIPDRLTWPSGVLAHVGIRAQPPFSTAVVSKVLARPVGAKTCHVGYRLPVSGADEDPTPAAGAQVHYSIACTRTPRRFISSRMVLASLPATSNHGGVAFAWNSRRSPAPTCS
jgi:hypothetical protein